MIVQFIFRLCRCCGFSGTMYNIVCIIIECGFILRVRYFISTDIMYLLDSVQLNELEKEVVSPGPIFRPSIFTTLMTRRIFINYTIYTLYLTGIFYFIYSSQIIIYENVWYENRHKNKIALVFFIICRYLHTLTIDFYPV